MIKDNGWEDDPKDEEKRRWQPTLNRILSLYDKYEYKDVAAEWMNESDDTELYLLLMWYNFLSSPHAPFFPFSCTLSLFLLIISSPSLPLVVTVTIRLHPLFLLPLVFLILYTHTHTWTLSISKHTVSQWTNIQRIKPKSELFQSHQVVIARNMFFPHLMSIPTLNQLISQCSAHTHPVTLITFF